MRLGVRASTALFATESHWRRCHRDERVADIVQCGPGDRAGMENSRGRVTTSLTRLGTGNWSNVKGVGAGVFEVKIDFGPGYRVYFGKDGETIVILLGGGTKKRQSRDIEAAQDHWKRYKKRKT
jgi:putative addiction module killer protein